MWPLCVTAGQARPGQGVRAPSWTAGTVLESREIPLPVPVSETDRRTRRYNFLMAVLFILHSAREPSQNLLRHPGTRGRETLLNSPPPPGRDSAPALGSHLRGHRIPNQLPLLSSVPSHRSEHPTYVRPRKHCHFPQENKRSQPPATLTLSFKTVSQFQLSEYLFFRAQSAQDWKLAA